MRIPTKRNIKNAISYNLSKKITLITLSLLVTLILMFFYTSNARIKYHEVEWPIPLGYTLIIAMIFSSFVGFIFGISSYRKREDIGKSKLPLIVFHFLGIITMTFGLLFWYAITNIRY